jgi:hypothetical protein
MEETLERNYDLEADVIRHEVDILLQAANEEAIKVQILGANEEAIELVCACEQVSHTASAAAVLAEFNYDTTKQVCRQPTNTTSTCEVVLDSPSDIQHVDRTSGACAQESTSIAILSAQSVTTTHDAYIEKNDEDVGEVIVQIPLDVYEYGELSVVVCEQQPLCSDMLVVLAIESVNDDTCDAMFIWQDYEQEEYACVDEDVDLYQFPQHMQTEIVLSVARCIEDDLNVIGGRGDAEDSLALQVTSVSIDVAPVSRATHLRQRTCFAAGRQCSRGCRLGVRAHVVVVQRSACTTTGVYSRIGQRKCH